MNQIVIGESVIEEIAEAVSAQIPATQRMTFLEQLEVIRIQTILEGMKAENTERESNGYTLAYDEAAFCKFADEITCIQQKYTDGLKRQAERMKAGRRRRRGNPGE